MTAAAAGSDGAARAPFPFRRLFSALVGGRGMDPASFWRLSVPELTALVLPGGGDGAAAPAAADLKRLMERFPDER